MDAEIVVVDFWRVHVGHEAALERELASCRDQFLAQPGVLSVDFTRVVDDPGRYLVVFRYADRATREAFNGSDLVRAAHTRLAPHWTLDSPVFRGERMNERVSES